MSARRWLVAGRVQGVGFRAFVVRCARSRGLRGWVRNLPDGRVEVAGEGEPAELDALEEDLRQGPRGSRVGELERFEEPEGGWSDFDVRF